MAPFLNNRLDRRKIRLSDLLAGLCQLAEFCRERLKIEVSAEKSSAETSFVVNLVRRGLQIVSAQLRIMWPFPPKDDN
jgi:hypothetical protein